VFERHPPLESYRKLLAESADAEHHKEQAVSLLRQRLDAGDMESRSRNPLLERTPATTLVDVLLYEGHADRAWAAASSYGCDDCTWMNLARAPRKHPSSRLHPDLRASRLGPDRHQEERRPPRRGRSPGPYSHPRHEGRRTRAVHQSAGGSDDGARKRNLIALIDKKRWT
jgi:hypothetical protein